MVIRKSEHLNSVKEMVSREHEENEKLISKLKEELEKEKARKRDRVRGHFKNTADKF